jgi:uncharacterized protein (TIGR04255 family)
MESLETIARVVEALPDWELQSRQMSQETQVIINNDGVQQNKGAAETVSVLHAVGDEGLRAAISPSSVAVECDRYTAWPRMHSAITDVFEACTPYITGACKRFGVRYINEIRDERADGDPGRLRQLLVGALLGPAVALDRVVLGSMQELRVAEDDGELALRHGLVRPGAYLLDLDRYSQSARPFAAAELAGLADRFHERIESVFVWALHPDYLTELQQPEESNA